MGWALVEFVEFAPPWLIGLAVPVVAALTELLVFHLLDREGL